MHLTARYVFNQTGTPENQTFSRETSKNNVNVYSITTWNLQLYDYATCNKSGNCTQPGELVAAGEQQLQLLQKFRQMHRSLFDAFNHF